MGKAEKTRQLIIEKASALFNVKGIAGTSVEDILKSARIARGCLYGHFESKEALVIVCVDHLLQYLSEKKDVVMSREHTALGKIFAFLNMNKDPLKPYIDGGCPVMNFSPETDDTNPIIKRRLKLDIDQYLALFTSILEEGIRRGEFSDRLKPADFAVKMFCAIKGALIISSVKNSALPARTVIRELKEELSNHLIKPIQNGPAFA